MNLSFNQEVLHMKVSVPQRLSKQSRILYSLYMFHMYLYDTFEKLGEIKNNT